MSPYTLPQGPRRCLLSLLSSTAVQKAFLSRPFALEFAWRLALSVTRDSFNVYVPGLHSELAWS